MRPNRSTPAETSWTHAASSDRSAAWNVASPPAPVIAPTVASPRARSRPVTTTRAPSAANAVAIAFPIPAVEPVTSAISPSRRTAGTVHRGLASETVGRTSAGPGEEGAGVITGAAASEGRGDRREGEQRHRDEHDGAPGGERPLPGHGQAEHDGDHPDHAGAERRRTEGPRYDPARGHG